MDNASRKTAIIVLSIIIFCTAIVTNYFTSPKIVTFDIKATTDIFLKQVAVLEVSEEQKSLLVKRYNKSLDDVIREYKEKNYIVFVKGAIVSDVEDKTSDIQQKIALKMKLKKATKNE